MSSEIRPWCAALDRSYSKRRVGSPRREDVRVRHGGDILFERSDLFGVDAASFRGIR